MKKALLIIAIATAAIMAAVAGAQTKGEPVSCGSGYFYRAGTEEAIDVYRQLGCNQFVVTDIPSPPVHPPLVHIDSFQN